MVVVALVELCENEVEKDPGYPIPGCGSGKSLKYALLDKGHLKAVALIGGLGRGLILPSPLI